MILHFGWSLISLLMFIMCALGHDFSGSMFSVGCFFYSAANLIEECLKGSKYDY